jgi:hypothetical protein
VWFIAIVLAGFLLSVFRLTSRYGYGPKSRRLLLLNLAGSLIAGLALARVWLRSEAGGTYVSLGGLGIALPLFVFSSLAAVEILRKRKQRGYDENLSLLRARQQTLLLELESLTREARANFRRCEEVAREGIEVEGLLAECQERVTRWQRGGGAARIRTIKVEEWRQEFDALSPAALGTRRSALQTELEKETEPERRSQLEAMLALATITASGREAPGQTAGLPDHPAAAGLTGRRRVIEAELASLQADISQGQRRLSDFLAKEIRLD